MGWVLLLLAIGALLAVNRHLTGFSERDRSALRALTDSELLSRAVAADAKAYSARGEEATRWASDEVRECLAELRRRGLKVPDPRRES